MSINQYPSLSPWGCPFPGLKTVGMGFGLTVSKIQKPPIGYKYPAEALISVPSGTVSSWFPLEGQGYVVDLFRNYSKSIALKVINTQEIVFVKANRIQAPLLHLYIMAGKMNQI